MTKVKISKESPWCLHFHSVVLFTNGYSKRPHKRDDEIVPVNCKTAHVEKSQRRQHDE